MARVIRATFGVYFDLREDAGRFNSLLVTSVFAATMLLMWLTRVFTRIKNFLLSPLK